MDRVRRQILQGIIASAGGFTFFTRKTYAQDESWLPLVGDDGKPVPNYRVPVELSTEGLPGIVWTESESPDVILVEFFDYNCPYCRKAAEDLHAIVTSDREFRLGLVNNAILNTGSLQAAKVQQAVLKLHGPVRAYEFHRALFRRRRMIDGRIAVQTAAALGLDIKNIEAAAAGADVASVLARQMKLAEGLAFSATPSFMLNGLGILGYPGPGAVARMIAAVRICDKPVCLPD